jgi:hypothetical protein
MSIMRPEYADDIFDIPCEEDENGLFNPMFENYGREQMTPTERKAVDLMNELDPTALDMVNISGLYLTIWKEIGTKAENVKNSATQILMKKTTLGRNYTENARELTEIDMAAQNAAWESIRTSVKWLAAEVRSRGKLTEIQKISMSMMSN